MGEITGEILLWIALVFGSGSLLLLERHCLGQRALVQPLVLSLLVGLITENLEAALWCGLTLQLLSVSPIRAVDWALSGVVTAATLALAHRTDIVIRVGSPEAALLMMVAVVTGTLSRKVERVFARADSDRVKSRSPWRSADTARAVEKTVYHALLRWILVGGAEVVVGVGIAILLVKGGTLLPLSAEWLRMITAVGCPAFGVAVALSALSETRFVAWSGVTMVLSMVFAWWMLV